MSYVRHILHDGERVLYETETHWAAYVPAAIQAAAAALAWLAISQYVNAAGVATTVTNAVHVVGGALSLVLFLRLAIVILEHRLEEHVVTTSRVIGRTGILRRDISVYPLRSIENVDTRQSLLGRILGYGLVEIHTAAEQHGVSGRGYIENPTAYQSAIVQAIRSGAPR